MFLDVVMAGISVPPAPGEEVWATDRALSPGGIANAAVGAARLGASTALVTAIGDDEVGDLVSDMLGAEKRLSLAPSGRQRGMQTALSVALSTAEDRSFISHGQLDPIDLASEVDAVGHAATMFVALDLELPTWVRKRRAAGTTVFGGVGWDERHGWSDDVLTQLQHVDVFVLNEREALSYTRTSTVEHAISRLGEFVAMTVITRGPSGALAFDAGSGVLSESPGIRVRAVDPTGAGDEFVAALMRTASSDMAVADRLLFANLCASYTASGLGGAVSNPTLHGLESWLLGHRSEIAADTSAVSDLITAWIDDCGHADQALPSSPSQTQPTRKEK
ncbi:carbohydrate kinase family protein [Lacisediminihabitans changchengi]|uniref:Carbohydrate kinase family protein n=1 Tax=Lacisediminihabitans changchengi TaxID=2787634 RepID=A0A934SJ90_9MICO|nr:carbohydrate kinase family protein [Lacisediminihabitans changchengi]MBK4346300.1 carbohydrate kinase family protein [Lacisediminihabitans changchengi]